MVVIFIKFLVYEFANSLLSRKNILISIFPSSARVKQPFVKKPFSNFSISCITVFTGTWLYIILLSLANSRNIPRSISFSSFCFSTYPVKSNAFSLDNFLIISLNSSFLSYVVLFSSCISNTICFSVSTLFIVEIFKSFRSFNLKER